MLSSAWLGKTRNKEKEEEKTTTLRLSLGR
jgi:hypothetical protein